MKLTSSFLFVATGLILCTSLSAQQYHDAAAFGLKGNVKECKVVDASDGSAITDDHHFSILGFTSDGKLDRWLGSYFDFNRVSYISEIDRSGGRLNGFLYDDSENYRFHYNGGILSGYSNSSFDIIEFTEVHTFHDDGKESFSVKSFMVEYDSTELDSVIEKGFNSGKDIFPILAAYCSSHSLDKYKAYIKEYIIRERDSHGNYTLLYNTKSGKSIKRIITYWDDEPKTAITEKTPGLRPATPKELSILDLITRPFGVLSQNSRKLSRKQLLYDLSDYGWVDKDNETLKINLRARDGYDMVILGKVPNWAYSEFDYNYDDHDYDTEKTALTSFGYHFKFDKRRETMDFVRRLLSLLEAQGINLKENRKYKYYEGKYGKSIVFLSPTPEGVYLRIRYKTYSPSDWIE